MSEATKLTRRDALKRIGAGVGLAALIGSGLRQIFLSNREETEEQPQQLKFTSAEKSLESLISIPHAPDTKMSFIPLGSDTFEVYFSGGQASYRTMWRWDSNSHAFTSLEDTTEVMTPDKSLHEPEKGIEGYRGVSSVLSVDDTTRIAFVHRELHQTTAKPFPFHAQISIVLSQDNGKSWGELSTILTEEFLEGKVSGVGQPSVLLVGNTVYCYYTRWGTPQDSIYLAKCPLVDISQPHSWQKSEKAVIAPTTEQVYSALPCVSFHEGRQEFIATYETNEGFYVSKSSDGTIWSAGELIIKNPSKLTERKAGDTWYSYPTHFFPHNNQEGILFYSSGVSHQRPHHPVMRTFTLT